MSQRVICYSGGHSSGLVAVEVARRFGTDGLVLLNHDIAARSEPKDVKRFKVQLASYLGLQITYANIDGLPPKQLPDQFDVCVKADAFQIKAGQQLCTSRLKTEPFRAWMREHASPQCIVYYGFDLSEKSRIQRRSSIIAAMGFQSDYPLALWARRTIHSTAEIGVRPPLTYARFKHANCVGCLKAGKQHWYLVFSHYPRVWAKAKWSEQEIGSSILPEQYLWELEPVFAAMKTAGVRTTENEHFNTFWSRVRKLGFNVTAEQPTLPCECAGGQS